LSKNQSILQPQEQASSENLSYKLFHSLKVNEIGNQTTCQRFNIFNDELYPVNVKETAFEKNLKHSYSNQLTYSEVDYPLYETGSTGAEISVVQTKTDTPYDKYTADWILLASLLGFTILIVIKQTRTVFFGKLFSSIIGYSHSSALYTEHKKNPSLILIWMNLIYILNFSILAYQTLQFLEISDQNPYLFSVGGIALQLTGLQGIRYLLSATGARIFKLQSADSEYRFHISQLNSYLGIIFYIGIFGIAYTPYPETAIGIVVIMFGLSYLLRIYRVYKINIKSSIRISYLFLYLCTLEILPFLALCRAVIDFVVR